MEVDWNALSRTGKTNVVGGALALLGAVLPWMSWSGGSASLLQDGKMEAVLSNGLSGTETVTIATSRTLLVALALAAVAIGLPLVRGWDWKSSLPSLLLAGVGTALFSVSALFLHGGGQEAILVGGEQVAETATPGVGLYAGLAGALVVLLASLASLVSTGLAGLRN
ncbi:hypothetical protein GCM10028857_27540 [Salinarchaeum chitinilyticum]